MSVVEQGGKSQLARELGVCRASLYYHRKIPEKDEALRREIEQLMIDNPGYGSPRVAIALKINKKRAARVMKKFGIKPARRAKTPRKPDDRGNPPENYPNILSSLCPTRPNVVWASDFTFISYRGEFLYLCTVMDVFTGEILGFNISRTHDAAFVRLAIERAWKKAGFLPDWFHSDQGSEYTSATVRAWLQGHDVSISMNPKSSPWCNGSQESLFGRFKVEFGDPGRFNTAADLLEALYDQLAYHTNVRIKTRLKMSPREFREKWLRERRKMLSFEIQQLFPRFSTSYESPPGPPSSIPKTNTTTAASLSV